MENYNEERLQAELDLIIAEREEREAREKLFLTLNTILNILGVGIIISIVLFIIIVYNIVLK